MKTNSWIALVLRCTPVLAVPPHSFGFPESQSDAQLSVTYQVNGSAQPVQPGILFGIDVPSQAPTVAVNESYGPLNYSYTGPYMLFMLDPDASYPENPQNRWIIHWWAGNLTKSNNTAEANMTSIGGTRLINTTAARVDYRRPRPPTNSSAHRYIQYLFEQPSNFSIPEAWSGYNSSNSSRFPFEKFIQATNLSNPVAANYFYCSNQSVVPAGFVAAPGGQYPSGNGAMVTQGTNQPSSTGVAGASSTGAAPSSTSSGAGSVVKVGSAPFGMAIAFMAWALL